MSLLWSLLWYQVQGSCFRVSRLLLRCHIISLMFTTYTENYACFCSNFVHLFIVGCICTIQDRFACFTYFQSSFCELLHLYIQVPEFFRLLLLSLQELRICLHHFITVYIYQLCIHSLTDTVVINLRDLASFASTVLVSMHVQRDTAYLVLLQMFSHD